MAISKHLLFSVLVFLLAFLLASSEPADNRRPTPCGPPPPSPPPPPPPADTSKFDYFLLALTWPNAICVKNNTCKPSVPKHQDFIIHGLWPQLNNGTKLEYCPTDKKMKDDILDRKEFKDDLLKYWPRLFSAENFNYSKKLWKEQWNKHGSCSADKLRPEAYLRTTIKLAKKYAPLITQKLKRDFKQDRSTLHKEADILKAVKSVTGTTAGMTCSYTDIVKRDLIQLDEIRLCVNKDGKQLQNCTRKIFGPADCNKGFVFLPPWNNAHSRFPSFVSSMLDVEEAVGI